MYVIGKMGVSSLLPFVGRDGGDIHCIRDEQDPYHPFWISQELYEAIREAERGDHHHGDVSCGAFRPEPPREGITK